MGPPSRQDELPTPLRIFYPSDDARHLDPACASQMKPQIIGLDSAYWAAIITVTGAALCTVAGFFIKRRWFPPTGEDGTTHQVPTPVSKVTALAHAYAGVVAERQISSLPREDAATRLREAAAAARDSAPRVADLALRLAGTSDPISAQRLLGALIAEAQTKRRLFPRRRNR